MPTYSRSGDREEVGNVVRSRAMIVPKGTPPSVTIFAMVVTNLHFPILTRHIGRESVACFKRITHLGASWKHNSSGGE